MVRGGIESVDAWGDAGLDNASFLAKNASVFQRVTLGCSFSPEEWGGRQQDEALRSLDYCVRELGLREVRTAIRWDRAARADGSIDLAYYRPFLDYCFDNKVSLSLNVGPMRTFRWPEDRAPGWVLASLPKVPAHGTTLDWGDPLAVTAVEYVARLIESLKREYGEEMLRLASVQPENESFQGFDQHSWRVTRRYMRELILRLDELLPGVPVLVTTAGRPALVDITTVFEELLAHHSGFEGRLISGFDYYYSTPNHNRIPFHSYLDPIALAFAFPSAKTCDENLQDSRSVGFRIEVSEAQAEPYSHVNAPGNSARDFRFMLLRCADKVLDPQQASILRIWGVEKLTKRIFAGETTSEHTTICDLVRRMNPSP